MLLNDDNRIRPNLDAWVIPGFAQEVLGVHPGDFLKHLNSRYPERRGGDSLDPFRIQWVEGSNEALQYRGSTLKRAKIWMQRGDPQTDGVLKYGYTGWQWRVMAATGNVADEQQCLAAADRYDEWSLGEGFHPANHYIVTRYADGTHKIGFHFDKPKDILPESLITVVKLGDYGRPFQLRWRGETEPFFDQVLPPGSALVMTVEANLSTQHAVPEVADDKLTGSMVFRSITTRVPVDQLEKKIQRANYGGKKRPHPGADGGQKKARIVEFTSGQS